MSLYCATGTVETDLSPRQLKTCSRKAWPSSESGTMCWPYRPTRPANIPEPAN